MPTLLEYHDFCETTAKFPEEKRNFYLRLGLLSELGELAALYKREIRDGTPIDPDKLLAELGDCLWYATMLIKRNHIECATLQENGRPVHLTTDLSSEEAFGLILECWIEQNDMLGVIEALSSYFGFTFDAIAGANMAKLSSRIVRGTIHGQGDDR